MRPPSLRSAFLFAGIALTAVAILLALALGGAVVQLATLSREFAHAVDSLHAVEEIEVNLLLATRKHSIYRQTGDERWLEEAREAQSALVRWLGEAQALVSSDEERVLLARLERQIDEVEKNLLNAPPSPRLLPWPEVDAAIADAGALFVLNEQIARAAVLRARRWSELATVLAATAILLLLTSLSGQVALTRRFVYLPVLRLRRALATRPLESGIAVPETGPLELREITADINALVARLVAQRAAQIEFLATVAHDLRNPMTSLRTAAQLVARESDPAKQQERSAMMMRQVDRMNRLVEDLLDTSRIKAGRFSLNLERRDLREVVREVAALFADSSERHEIRFELPDEAVLVDHDPARIAQILGNLVSNAIKYSPAGGPIDLRLRTESGRALVEVRDRGLGIPPAEYESIFEPFQRGQGLLGEIPGVGLGLPVARRLARAHGGDIEVESEPGRGSTFRLVLLLAGGAPPPPTRDQGSRAMGSSGSSR